MFRCISIVRTTILAMFVASILTASAFAQKLSDHVKLENNKIYVALGSEQSIEIVDGDTLWMGNHQIRLQGIDALEPKQDCLIDGHPRSYCHNQASAALRKFAHSSDFYCVFEVKDGENRPWVRYGRYVSTCFSGDINVNEEMVRLGWALPHWKYGTTYKELAVSAKHNGVGVHATEFDDPYIWRKMKREQDDRCLCK